MAGLIVVVVGVVNPWPAALAIRALFTLNAQATVTEMTKYVPGGVDERGPIQYADGGPDTTLSVFFPSGQATPLGTVVWIHGGAWISGSSENVDPYARIIASHGFTAVTLDYTVSPEATYPTALTQLNTALAFLVAHAAEYNIDPSRIVIAGDSAGAQLTSQLADLITNPAAAADLRITPALAPSQLAGVVLDCGIYDVSGIPNAPGIGGWGFRAALWSYLGQKDWAGTAGARQMSTIDSVTRAFPPTWISGGNADPLTETQSIPFAAKLTSLGVPVTEVFYDQNHEPSLPHEYQFHLDSPDARSALESTLQFLQKTVGDSSP